MPIGGVVAYRDHISPSGVGFDIGCGNLAVRTGLTHDADRRRPAADHGRDLRAHLVRRRPQRRPGRRPRGHRRHPHGRLRAAARARATLAAKQLGTVGAGNHYVDLFRDEDDDRVWIGVHFGSRGFGHKTASGFLALAQGLPFDGRAHEGEMMSPPVVFDAASGARRELRRRDGARRRATRTRAARSSSPRCSPSSARRPTPRSTTTTTTPGARTSTARPRGSCARAPRRPSPASAASSARRWASRR